MKSTLILFGLCITFLIPCLASAQMTSQEYDQLGQAVYQKGLYDKAVAYFQQATQADPSNAQAFEDLGNAYMKEGNQSQALQAYQQSLQLNPNNPTLKNMVDNLNNSTNAPSNAAPSQPAQNNEEMEQAPGQQTLVIHRHRPRPQPAPVNYNDNLAPMDHARLWTRFEFGYNYSTQTDLMNSVTSANNENTNGTLPFGFTSGSATMPVGGLMLGGELGFLINPNSGIAIGVRYLQANDYNYSATDSNPATISGNNGLNADGWSTVMTPYVVPLTLDYYLFLPDHDGRFFITGGVGYYAGTVQVTESYSVVNNQYATNNPSDWADAFNTPAGNLTAGNIGFQVGLGRDFAIGRNFGLSVFGRFHYCKLTQFQGTLSDGGSWVLAKFKDGTVDIDNPANIGSNGETYATIDFTGFDIGAALNFYSF